MDAKRKKTINRQMLAFAQSIAATTVTFEEVTESMKRLQEIPKPKIENFKFLSDQIEPITIVYLQNSNSVNPASRKYKNKKFR